MSTPTTDTPSEHTQEPDAWLQLCNLLERFTQERMVRRDLIVTALATERKVRLRTDPSVTDHNVGTMRELAEAILVACDFVDDSNPTWASYRP